MHYDIEWLKNEATDHKGLKFLYFWGHTNQSNEVVGKSYLR